MPKKPTQEDIVNLARKGGNDAHLFVLEKVLDVKEDVSELELAIVGTENKLSTLDEKVTSLTTDIDSTLSEMEEDVLDKISSLEKELSNLDNNFRTFDMSAGVEQIIKNLSVVKGIKGEKGDKGDPGKDGKDGQDAVVDLEELRLSIIEEFPTTDDIVELISESTDARIGFLENELESLDVKEKLESLEGDDRLDYSAIKNTPDMDSVASQVALRMPHGGGTSLEVFDSTGKVGSGSALKFIGATVTHDGHMGTVTVTGGAGDMTAAVYDPASITEQLVGLTASQTLTNKSIDVDNNTITNAGNLDVARTAGSTYSTIQHIQDLFHSAGWTSGGVITSNGDGTCAVTAGTGLIRATDSDIDTIYFTDFAANASLALVNNDVNYIYVEYNAGSPQVVSTTTARTDYNTNFIIGEIYRDGTTLHINQTVKSAVSDHAGKMIRFNQEVMPYAHVSGGAISETGTRNIAITAGAFWEGLIRFSTNSFDSSAAGTFVYYYRDGVGGWTAVSSSTQIDNTQYDNNTGTLATLTNNRYGVHWVYLGTDSHVYVVYGRGDYLLTQAQDAMPPSDLPDVISSHGFLVGKIIIQKNASTFTQIESAFMTMFIPSIASEHNSLSGLQGGTSDEYYHLTSAEYSALTIATPTTYTPSGTTQTITFADNDQLAILDLGSASGNVTLTLSGMTAGGAYTIKVIQGATARNLVFPASVIASSSQTAWDTGTQTLTMTATDDAVDVVGLTYDGTSTLLTAEFDLS